MTDAGLLAFRRLLQGPLPLVRPGAPARRVQPPLLRPAVLQDLLHVQPVSRRARGPVSSTSWPCGLSTGRCPRKMEAGRRKTHVELLDLTACVPVCARTCVCVCVCVCVHPWAHRHTLGGEEAWSQGRASQPARPEPPSSGKADQPRMRKRAGPAATWRPPLPEAGSAPPGCVPRPASRPSGGFSARGPQRPRPGELVSILMGRLASGNGKGNPHHGASVPFRPVGRRREFSNVAFFQFLSYLQVSVAI